MSSQGFILFDTKIDVTPAVRSSWEEIDVSQWLPSDATGVILHSAYDELGRDYFCARKKGSTDDFSANSKLLGTNLILCGVDDDKKFEAYVGDEATAKLYLIGYTDSSVVFLTNVSSRITTTLNAWIDENAAPDVPSDATGVIVLMVNTDAAASRTAQIRQKNSTNDLGGQSDVSSVSYVYLICGLTHQLFQQKIGGATTNECYIAGYVLSPITVYMNLVDISIGTVDEWIEVDTGLAGKSIAIIACNNTDSEDTRMFKFRKIGESSVLEYGDDESRFFYDENRFFLVALDSSGKFEAKIDDLQMKTYLHGFTEEPIIEPTTSASDWTNVMNLPDLVTENAEYILDFAIDELNLRGTSISNLSGTAGSKTVSLTSEERAGVFEVARAIYYSFFKGIETVTGGGMAVSSSDLMSNPVVVALIEKIARRLRLSTIAFKVGEAQR